MYVFIHFQYLFSVFVVVPEPVNIFSGVVVFFRHRCIKAKINRVHPNPIYAFVWCSGNSWRHSLGLQLYDEYETEQALFMPLSFSLSLQSILSLNLSLSIFLSISLSPSLSLSLSISLSLFLFLSPRCSHTFLPGPCSYRLT